MPELCLFLGIVIYMLFDDHRPPHFHAEYGEYHVTMGINDGVVEGRFPRRALAALMECTACTGRSCLKIGRWPNSTSP